MRVLLVSHHAPPHIGGVEQVVWTEAQSFLAAGHEVTWVTSDGTGAGEHPSHPRLRLLRLPAWHGFERRFQIAYPLYAPSLLRALWREVEAADLVHVHGLVFQGSVVAAVLARLRGRRCVLTDHGGALRYRSRLGTWGLRLLIETAGRLTARCADRLVAINGDLERLLRRLNGGRGDVISLANPVARARFSPPSAAQRRSARRSLGWDSRPRVLFVGRLVPSKGVDVLLESAAMLRPAPPALVFCGPGDRTQVSRIEGAGAEYLAPRPQQELVQLYHAADVLALPSRNEGFPLVVQEALACGLPVVTSADAAYAPYRRLPDLHLCEPTSRAVCAALGAVLARRRTRKPRPASGTLDGDAWLARLLEGLA